LIFIGLGNFISFLLGSRNRRKTPINRDCNKVIIPIFSQQMKPKPIGNRVGLVAPASPSSQIKEAVSALEGMGFEVIKSKGLELKETFFAGSDKLRASELKKFLLRQDISAVFCIRGGYGSARLLPILRGEKFCKLFIGFSDITALQAQRSFNGSIHSSLFLTKTEQKLLLSLMSSQKPMGDILTKKREIEVGRRGRARGKLFASNLTVLCSLLGTPYFPNLSGAILCLEDVNEQPYRVDRMLTQLILAGVLKKVRGFCFGDFGKGDYDSVIMERVSSFGVPVLLNLPFGHGKRRMPIPQWINAEMDSGNKELILLESVVAG
jgi:muramoyltetrapeptide carboxypeptidase